MTSASLEFPEGRDAPIAADLRMTEGGGADVHAVFRLAPEPGPPADLDDRNRDTARPARALAGRAELAIDGAAVLEDRDREYEGIYARFRRVESKKAENQNVDLSPLTHVADAFMLGRRIVVEPFED